MDEVMNGKIELTGFIADGIKEAYFIPPNYKLFLNENGIIAVPYALEKQPSFIPLAA